MSTSESGIEGVFECLIKFTIDHVIKTLAFNCRLAHRNRLNIFDIIKAVSAVRMSLLELKLYILWMNSCTSDALILKKVINIEKIFNQPTCKSDLKFFIEISDTKKPGFEYFPPTPPSFTYKFTPVRSVCISSTYHFDFH